MASNEAEIKEGPGTGDVHLEIVSMHTASKVIALDKVTKEMNLEKRG
jgi:precorrin-6B methylase 2